MVVPPTKPQDLAEPPRKRSRWLTLLVVLVVVLALLAAAAGLYWALYL
jgi:flagellar basal body-associated protein FliL